jgi:murein DD-endopeptidase MepM/ murein hydrolase activator NlpD
MRGCNEEVQAQVFPLMRFAMVRRLLVALLVPLTLFVLMVTTWAVPTHHVEPDPDLDAVADLDAPWSCNATFRVSQGHHGATHDGWGRYAWDFSTPEGTTITAPAAGVVRFVRDDSRLYGCDPRFGWDANYVVIDLQNGYDVLLLHLMADSALVEVGQPVEAGQPVGQVGNSGWVCGTHLHMQVQRRCESWWCPSEPATLQGRLPDRGDLLFRQCG